MSALPNLGPEFTRWRDDILGMAEETMLKALAQLQVGHFSRTVDVPIVLGAPGTPLTTSDHAFVRLGLGADATIISWSLAATVAGTATSGNVALNVLVGSTLATVATIVSTHPPELTADIELNDQPPTSWTVVVPDPSWLKVTVTSVDGTLEVVGLTLRLVVG